VAFALSTGRCAEKPQDARHRGDSQDPPDRSRIGVLFGLLGTLSTIVLAIGLYVTLKPVDGNLAMTALLFRLAEATIGGVVVVLAFATLQDQPGREPQLRL
jgi:hypothetical protein